MSKFYQEVMGQPEQLRHMLQYYQKENFSSIYLAAQWMQKSGNVVFSGMGTSYYAPSCIYGSLCNSFRTIMIEAGELVENCTGLLHDGDTLVLISQSGESVEISHLIQNRPENVKLIAITNEPESTLAKAGDLMLPLCATPEASITNKTFTNTLALLFLLQACVCQEDPAAVATRLKMASHEMDQIPAERKAEITEIAKAMMPADVIHFIARGPSAVTLANQSALIFMEGASCMARAFTSGSFRHGPIEVCSENHRAVVYACDPQTSGKVQQLISQMESHGSVVAVVTNQNIKAKYTFSVSAQSSMEFALIGAMFMELLLVEVASGRGRTAGEFSITQKICKVD